MSSADLWTDRALAKEAIRRCEELESRLAGLAALLPANATITRGYAWTAEGWVRVDPYENMGDDL